MKWSDLCNRSNFCARESWSIPVHLPVASYSCSRQSRRTASAGLGTSLREMCHLGLCLGFQGKMLDVLALHEAQLLL